MGLNFKSSLAGARRPAYLEVDAGKQAHRPRKQPALRSYGGKSKCTSFMAKFNLPVDAIARLLSCAIQITISLPPATKDLTAWGLVGWFAVVGSAFERRRHRRTAQPRDDAAEDHPV